MLNLNKTGRGRNSKADKEDMRTPGFATFVLQAGDRDVLARVE